MANTSKTRRRKRRQTAGARQLLGLPERFWTKVAVEERGYETRCWIWTAYCLPNGYARFKPSDGPVGYAHRIAYEAIVGPIPPGLVIDHLCRNRSCVNPNHLEPVTNRVNILRGETIMAANVKKTHCKNGHEFNAENTIVMANGCRNCRACQDSWREERNARRRAETAARGPKPLATHCRHGHVYDAENTIAMPGGARGCRVCQRAACARYQRRRRERGSGTSR